MEVMSKGRFLLLSCLFAPRCCIYLHNNCIGCREFSHFFGATCDHLQWLKRLKTVVGSVGSSSYSVFVSRTLIPLLFVAPMIFSPIITWLFVGGQGKLPR